MDNNLEIPLYDDEACNLSAINLQNFVDFNGNFNYERLDDVTKTIVRFLDNSIDLNNYPDDLIKKAVLKTRKLGIGVLGLHGMLIKKGLQYNSEKGRRFAKSILKRITDTAQKYSELLIEEGRILPESWYGSEFEEQGIKIRNLSVTSGQPTGATQILLDKICCSSGIEPIFSICYTRNVRGEKFNLANSLFEEIGKEEGWFTNELIEKIINNNGSCQNIPEVPEKWRFLFLTSTEINWEDHVKMQAELQQVTTNALSKTINMSSLSTKDDVYNAYMSAYDLKCKGVTVYVSGSREGQVLSAEKKKEHSPYVSINPTLEMANAKRVKIKTGCGSMWLMLVTDDDGKLREIFAQSGSSGGCKGMTEGMSRICSLALRANVDPMVLVDQLKSVSCDVSKEARKKDPTIGKSCSDGIARQIIKFLENQNSDYRIPVLPTKNEKNVNPITIVSKEKTGLLKCPECGQLGMVKYDGCVRCENCSFMRCQ